MPQVADALHDIGMPTDPPDRLLQDLKAACASVKGDMSARVGESCDAEAEANIRVHVPF